MAEIIYDALDRDENIASVDNCATRLRLEGKDIDQVDQNKIYKVKEIHTNSLSVSHESDL
ncbi:PTS transporter subunit EIIB [Salinibacillus kushneri]|uniref:PTS transporter subunit EIIB n=1 Tax=Salinibacillus kushneri TaxID=237682 RepID=UPI000B860357|nr:PTS transporter subunit EIIB [Salinibacillus kushneri]